MQNSRIKLPVIVLLSLAIWSCGDDAMRRIGDTMSDAAAALRDVSADALADGGAALEDSGVVTAQTCSSCARRFEVVVSTTASDVPTDGFNVDAYSSLHIARTLEGGTSCRVGLEAQFGSEWVAVGAPTLSGVSNNGANLSHSHTPIASTYRLRVTDPTCATVIVHGEIRQAR